MTTNKPNKPSNLTEIRKIAESTFADPAAVSVKIEATFGTVTVYRDGTVKMK